MVLATVAWVTRDSSLRACRLHQGARSSGGTPQELLRRWVWTVPVGAVVAVCCPVLAARTPRIATITIAIAIHFMPSTLEAGHPGTMPPLVEAVFMEEDRRASLTGDRCLFAEPGGSMASRGVHRLVSEALAASSGSRFDLVSS